MKKSFRFKKPKAKGWGRKPVAKVAKSNRPAHERFVAEAPVAHADGLGYFSGPCCVLLAAVFGTRAAYDWATDALPIARFDDARRFWK
jgi:hypothetical protein